MKFATQYIWIPYLTLATCADLTPIIVGANLTFASGSPPLSTAVGTIVQIKCMTGMMWKSGLFVINVECTDQGTWTEINESCNGILSHIKSY